MAVIISDQVTDGDPVRARCEQSSTACGALKPQKDPLHRLPRWFFSKSETDSATTPRRVNTCQVLTDSYLKAENGFDAPDRVVPKLFDAPPVGSKMALQVPARSFALLNLGLT